MSDADAIRSAAEIIGYTWDGFRWAWRQPDGQLVTGNEPPVTDDEMSQWLLAAAGADELMITVTATNATVVIGSLRLDGDTLRSTLAQAVVRSRCPT